MGFRMFANQHSPIAIDFGSTSVKLLQTEPGEKGGAPSIVAAAELTIPDAVRLSPTERMTFIQSNLPKLIKSSGFKGQRAVCAMPASQTMLQHLQISIPDGVKLDDAVKSELQLSMGINPGTVVVRPQVVTDVTRDGQTRSEIISIAMPREHVMQHIALLESCRLQVTGVYAQVNAIIHAFDHIYRREEDENVATMYIDLGWSSTSVVITHGDQMVFARAIQVGGQHFDQLIMKAHRCELAAARSHRLSIDVPMTSSARASTPASANQEASEVAAGGLARLTAAMAASDHADSGASQSDAAMATMDDRRDDGPAPEIAAEVQPTDAPKAPANVDFSELLETMTDELSMSLRYHRGLFPNQQVDRVVLLGGEAKQNWLCKHVAKAMRLPARLGDPLARFAEGPIGALDRSKPQPGWAAVCGLCARDLN